MVELIGKVILFPAGSFVRIESADSESYHGTWYKSMLDGNRYPNELEIQPWSFDIKEVIDHLDGDWVIKNDLTPLKNLIKHKIT